MLALPSWLPFSHRPDGEATLFVMTDEPVMRMLGWLRSEDAA